MYEGGNVPVDKTKKERQCRNEKAKTLGEVGRPSLEGVSIYRESTRQGGRVDNQVE